jgi:hypothetical protein
MPFGIETDIPVRPFSRSKLPPTKGLNHGRSVESDRGGELDKLDYVDSTVATLDGRDERLMGT